MKALSLVCALLLVSSLAAVAADAPKELIGDPKILGALDPVKTRETGVKASEAAEKIGWRIGSQAYTLRDRTLTEALDTLYMLGIKYVEAFPGQAVAPEYKNVKFGPDATQESLGLVRQKLNQTGIKILSIGVIGIPADEQGARKLFQFAKDFGMERIVSEATEKQFDMIEKLADEYNIDVALHNHPKPSYYWDPNHVLKAVQNYPRIGSCADVGHWQRSGVKPIDALKLLDGHVFESHFKDLNEFGNTKAHDVPWGTGTGDAKGMLEECYRQTKEGKIGGTFKKMTYNIEYEIGKGPELVGNMAKCVEWFGKECEELGGK
ncbi:MAG TPA: TIM barrel protein [Tepidisphaeraceae bacterium]|jgi:sugar phosphate isomerase/epimerase